MRGLWAGICCAAAVPLGTVILLILSRREEVPRAAGEAGPRLLVRPAAYLNRTFAAGKRRKNSAAADLAVLYPSRRAEGRETVYGIRKLCHILCILLLGSLLSGAAVLSTVLGQRERTAEGAYRLERESYGGSGREELLKAEVGDLGEVEVPVTVSARRYTSAQLDVLAEELTGRFPELFLGENTKPDRICHDLALPGTVEGFPFRILWESDDPEILSDDGRITCGEEAADGRKVVLTAVFTAEAGSGVRSYERTFALKVFPPELEPQLRLRRRLEQLLAEIDEETDTGPYLELPGQLEEGGQPILWSGADTGPAVLLFVIAAAAAVLYAPLSDRQLHRETIRRERQLREDYPVLVSRLALYLGAGMSLRNIFLRLGDDYRGERLRGEKPRYLGEEILLLVREMESGIPEAEAYARFGTRCRCNVYARLTSLLTQNLRKGNRALLSVLHREARDAFQERRVTARIRGEEAETGLLIPMVMMLAVTMLIIMIPAYLSFTV